MILPPPPPVLAPRIIYPFRKFMFQSLRSSQCCGKTVKQYSIDWVNYLNVFARVNPSDRWVVYANNTQLARYVDMRELSIIISTMGRHTTQRKLYAITRRHKFTIEFVPTTQQHSINSHSAAYTWIYAIYVYVYR